MKLKQVLKYITHPKKAIHQRAQKEAEKILRRQYFIPIQETQPEDVFLVAFPKSGITWLQHLVSGLQYGIDTQYLPDKLVQEIIPDIYVSRFYKRFGDLKIFKSHELPQPQYKRVIYLVRDGRDAMVSYYHFQRKLGKKVSLEEMVIQHKEVYPAPWWGHIRQWLQNPYKAEIIYIRYEDLLNKPTEELKKICDFLGFKRDETLIEKIIQGSTINKMREKAILYGGLNHPDWRGEKGVEFFRKGKAGSYKEEMSDELIHYFTQNAKKELSHFGYEIMD